MAVQVADFVLPHLLVFGWFAYHLQPEFDTADR